MRGKGSSSSKISTLIVDDDPLTRRIHKVLLTKVGLETQAVENGKEAVDLYRSGASFDLILMDLEMPIMDRPKATKELRAMGVQSMIVGVTARDLEVEKQMFMASGLDDCYVKPLTTDTVTALVEKLNKDN
ncbi:Two-component response regulator ARR22 [Vitis vinifera]|uniref:Two-component response regulator ARR22 n=1 Tax=Vitis vinifera TaxID=29760 RepID=A0A438FKQ5_VITVI|nr:Two-component response regulator ARR22 [Vitis vinifera]